ncbi:MAG: YraN family protein [Clostridiaceae bacterium]|nr:YraN family protein [Clostridiaceae bacterium]
MNNIEFGRSGEQIAADYLKRNGFRILERNFRSGRYGEVDIIASEGEYICFIEVKTRTGNAFGTPAEAVGASKQQKIRSLAWIYLKQKGMGDRYMRFDVIEVIGRRSDKGLLPEKINLIRGAF